MRTPSPRLALAVALLWLGLACGATATPSPQEGGRGARDGGEDSSEGACVAAGGECVAVTPTSSCAAGNALDSTHSCSGVGSSCCMPSKDGGTDATVDGGTPTPSSGWPGFGYATTGGAGKPTVHVTNLNDSGPGSFRDAVGSNRTIVFDVGGTIPLTSSDIVFQSVTNVTIDGSTAPAPGVIFTQRGINFRSSNNVIVTNIRHRGGFNAGSESGGCVTFFPNCYNVVLDHCSFSGFQDEAIDLWNGNHDVTIQNCIVGAGMSGTGHNYECLIGEKPYNITVYRNLFHRGEYRNPAIGYDDANGTTSPVLSADVINNVTYGWTAYGITIYWGAKANVIGNWLWTDASGMNTPSRALDVAALGQAYASGNYLKGGSTPVGNQSGPFSVPSAAQITPSSAVAAATYVKANAGCRVGGLDAVDHAILDDLIF